MIPLLPLAISPYKELYSVYYSWDNPWLGGAHGTWKYKHAESVLESDWHTQIPLRVVSWTKLFARSRQTLFSQGMRSEHETTTVGVRRRNGA